MAWSPPPLLVCLCWPFRVSLPPHHGTRSCPVRTLLLPTATVSLASSPSYTSAALFLRASAAPTSSNVLIDRSPRYEIWDAAVGTVMSVSPSPCPWTMTGAVLCTLVGLQPATSYSTFQVRVATNANIGVWSPVLDIILTQTHDLDLTVVACCVVTHHRVPSFVAAAPDLLDLPDAAGSVVAPRTAFNVRATLIDPDRTRPLVEVRGCSAIVCLPLQGRTECFAATQPIPIVYAWSCTVGGVDCRLPIVTGERTEVLTLTDGLADIGM